MSSCGVRASGFFGFVFLDERFCTAARADWGREAEMIVSVAERLRRLSWGCFLVLS